VFELMRGDIAAEECAKTLRGYEKKWDLQHVAPPLEVYVEDFTIKTRSPERFSHVVGLPEDEALWQEYVFERYYGFLSDTHLVLDTTAYSDDYDIIFSNKYSFQATARGWGGMYAEWANRTRWQGREDWDYVHFYANWLFKQVEDYKRWADAAYGVIGLKTGQESSA
jgi:hypothetical protein